MAIVDKARLAQIEEWADTAVKGPWQVKQHPSFPRLVIETGLPNLRQGQQYRVAEVVESEFGPQATRLNARFVAQARQDVPDLCETVRDAWEQRDLAREQLRVLVGQNDALQEALRRLKEPKS